MDLTDTIAPTSDQLDAVDLLSGPRTFTIERVSKGNAEQPVNIALFGFPRPWRPGKSMRRVLVACWGPDASKYAGRRVTLYCDLEVRFGGQAVGGTRVSHLSHLDKPKPVPLLVSRGKSAMFMVRPLVETTKSRVADLKHEWKTADTERRAVIEAEAAALSGPNDDPGNAPTAAEVPAEPATAEEVAEAVAPQVPNDDTAREPATPPEPAPEQPVESQATQTYLTAVHAGLTTCGVTDRDEKVSTLSRLVNRSLSSSAELTKTEASAVIRILGMFTSADDPAAALQDYLLDLAQAAEGNA